MNGLRNLPPGWEWRKFEEVARVVSNLVDPALYPNHPHLAPNHIIPESGRYEGLVTVAEDAVTSPKHLFKPGQIVYSKIRPYLRKAVVTEIEGLCSADMYPIETDLETRYLMWWMLSGEFTELALKGRSVIPKINQRELNALPVPVPPPAEQQEIVEIVERTMSHLTVAESRVSSVQRRVSLLNASMLNQVTTVPSAKTVALADIAEVVAGPAFKSAQFADDVTDGTRLVRGSNVAPGRLHWGAAETEYWPNTLLSDYEKYLLMEGDVILAMDRPVISTGLKLAMAQKDDLPALLVQRVARIRAYDPVLARWIYLCLLAPSFIPHMLTDTTGTQLPHITLEGIRSFHIPNLSANEIARRIDAADAVLSQSQRLAITGTASLERIHAIRRAILKAAFEGRLTGSRVLSDGALEEAIA